MNYPCLLTPVRSLLEGGGFSPNTLTNGFRFRHPELRSLTVSPFVCKLLPLFLKGRLEFVYLLDVFIMDALAERATENLDAEATAAVEELTDQILAIQKLINLDQQVAMDTYIDSYSQEIEETVAEQEALINQVENDLEAPIQEVSEAAEDITESATVVSDSVTEQTDRMQEASSELGNLSATIEEIASTATEVAETSDRGG